MQVFGADVRFCVQASPTRLSYEDYVQNWLRCERLGFEVAYATDHLVSGASNAGSSPVFEGPTLLAALAALTTRMRCGIMVASNTFRHPRTLARIATTLDHVSGGRFELGMGAGHNAVEHQQYAIPFYTPGQRIRMLSESAKIVRGLLHRGEAEVHGQHYSVREHKFMPMPVQERLPLLIGASGEQLALRVVAESADIWNIWTDLSPDEYQAKLLTLHGYCEEVGRDPGEIRKSIHIKPLVGETEAEVRERAGEQPAARWRGTTEQLTESLLRFVELGVGDFVFMLDAPADLRSLDLIAAHVAPAVRDEGRVVLSAAS